MTVLKKQENKDTTKYLNIILETACAEFGSALEMLKACKDSKKENMAYGYFEHSKDEYNHTKTFLSILSKFGKSTNANVSRNFRFNTNSVLSKGYVSREGYLVETMKIKDFIAYVYTNELLAKESFEGILKLQAVYTKARQYEIVIMANTADLFAEILLIFLQILHFFRVLQPLRDPGGAPRVPGPSSA